MMNAADWELVSGKATIAATSVDMSGTAARPGSSRPARSPRQDMVLETQGAAAHRPRLRHLVPRPPAWHHDRSPASSFQYDPRSATSSSSGSGTTATECCNPIANTPFPSGMKINGRTASSSPLRATRCTRRSTASACSTCRDLATAIASELAASTRRRPARQSASAPGVHGTSAVFSGTPRFASCQHHERGAPPATAGPLVSRCGQRLNRQQVAREPGVSQHAPLLGHATDLRGARPTHDAAITQATSASDHRRLSPGCLLARAGVASCHVRRPRRVARGDHLRDGVPALARRSPPSRP